MFLRLHTESLLEKQKKSEDNALIKLISVETHASHTSEYFQGLVGASFDSSDSYRLEYSGYKLQDAISLIRNKATFDHVLEASNLLIEMANLESNVNSGEKFESENKRSYIPTNHPASRLRLTAIFLFHCYHFIARLSEKLINALKDEHFKKFLSDFNGVMDAEKPDKETLNALFSEITKRPLFLKTDLPIIQKKVADERDAKFQAAYKASVSQEVAEFKLPVASPVASPSYSPFSRVLFKPKDTSKEKEEIKSKINELFGLECTFFSVDPNWHQVNFNPEQTVETLTELANRIADTNLSAKVIKLFDNGPLKIEIHGQLATIIRKLDEIKSARNPERKEGAKEGMQSQP